MTGYKIVRVWPSSVEVTERSKIVFGSPEEAESIRKTLAVCQRSSEHPEYWYTMVVSVVVPEVIIESK